MFIFKKNFVHTTFNFQKINDVFKCDDHDDLKVFDLHLRRFLKLSEDSEHTMLVDETKRILFKDNEETVLEVTTENKENMVNSLQA